MKTLFLLTMLVATAGFANESEEVAAQEAAKIKKVLPALEGQEEIVQEEAQVQETEA